MNDIKVGEYIRTRKGFIGKADEVDNSYIFSDLDALDISYEEMRSYVSQSDVVKHSFEIIDLIEVGDYVNGYKVIHNTSDTEKEMCNGEYHKCIIVESKFGEWKMVDWDIKTIVTHEQFNSIKYVLGGKKE